MISYLVDKFIDRYRERKCDLVLCPPNVNTPYMYRWYILYSRYASIYLHCFTASDYDTVLHDHTAHNISILIKGSYREEFAGGHFLTRKTWKVSFRKASTPHRIHITPGDEVWSIFIKGPIFREWGFHCSKGWVNWKEFVRKRDDSNINNGCG